MIAAVLALGMLIGLSLGALGGGGSILTVPALVYVVGQDAREATTSSLFIVGITGLIGALGHARSGRLQWGIGISFGLAGVAASFAGTAANRLVDPDVLLLAFSVLIVLAAVGMFAKTRPAHASPAPERQRVPSAAARSVDGRDRADASSSPAHGPSAVQRAARTRRVTKILAAGLAVGFLTGFFGVGGGFVIVPALTLALGMSMSEAVATSLLVIAINSGASLAARASTAQFDWQVIVPFTLAAVAGSLAGKKVADRLSGTALTRSFAFLLIAVALYTATSSIVALTH